MLNNKILWFQISSQSNNYSFNIYSLVCYVKIVRNFTPYILFSTKCKGYLLVDNMIWIITYRTIRNLKWHIFISCTHTCSHLHMTLLCIVSQMHRVSYIAVRFSDRNYFSKLKFSRNEFDNTVHVLSGSDKNHAIMNYKS